MRLLNWLLEKIISDRIKFETWQKAENVEVTEQFEGTIGAFSEIDFSVRYAKPNDKSPVVSYWVLHAAMDVFDLLEGKIDDSLSYEVFVQNVKIYLLLQLSSNEVLVNAECRYSFLKILKILAISYRHCIFKEVQRKVDSFCDIYKNRNEYEQLISIEATSRTDGAKIVSDLFNKLLIKLCDDPLFFWGGWVILTEDGEVLLDGDFGYTLFNEGLKPNKIINFVNVEYHESALKLFNYGCNKYWRGLGEKTVFYVNENTSTSRDIKKLLYSLSDEIYCALMS